MFTSTPIATGQHGRTYIAAKELMVGDRRKRIGGEVWTVVEVDVRDTVVRVVWSTGRTAYYHPEENSGASLLLRYRQQ